MQIFCDKINEGRKNIKARRKGKRVDGDRREGCIGWGGPEEQRLDQINFILHRILIRLKDKSN